MPALVRKVAYNFSPDIQSFLTLCAEVERVSHQPSLLAGEAHLTTVQVLFQPYQESVQTQQSKEHRK